MKLFDFRKRQIVPPAAVTKPTPAPTEPRAECPEDIIKQVWAFEPTMMNGGRQYRHEDIVAITAICSARALTRLADDVEAIRKYLTRLQLVDQQPASRAPEE